MCCSQTARPAPEFFAVQLSDPCNGTCCDGGSGCAEWASVSHGIYISIAAAGVHRSMGVRTSFVQSTVMDAWKPLHLRMMELGGNRRFNDFLRQHGIPEDTPIREKYATRAAAWYRRNLRAEAEGSELPEQLREGTGHLPESEAGATDAILNRVFAEATEGPPAISSSKSVPSLGASVSARRRSKAILRKQSSKSLPDLDDAEEVSSSVSKMVCDSLSYAIRLAKIGGMSIRAGAKYDSDESDLDRSTGESSPEALPSLLIARKSSEADSPANGVRRKSSRVQLRALAA